MKEISNQGNLVHYVIYMLSQCLCMISMCIVNSLIGCEQLLSYWTASGSEDTSCKKVVWESKWMRVDSIRQCDTTPTSYLIIAGVSVESSGYLMASIDGGIAATHVHCNVSLCVSTGVWSVVYVLYVRQSPDIITPCMHVQLS